MGRRRRVGRGRCRRSLRGSWPAVEPRLTERGVDDLEERPDGPGRHPGIGVALHTRGGRHSPADQRRRIGKVDVCAHAVGPAGCGAEPGREPLAQPPLHPAGGNAYDLGDHRVVERVDDDVAEGCHQGIGPFGSVDVQGPVNGQTATLHATAFTSGDCSPRASPARRMLRAALMSADRCDRMIDIGTWPRRVSSVDRANSAHRWEVCRVDPNELPASLFRFVGEHRSRIPQPRPGWNG